MKNSPLPPLLAGVLLLIGLITALITVRYYFSVKEFQKLQLEYARITNKRSAAQALANDAIEYSRRNPEIDPILYQFEVKQKPGTGVTPPATPKPAK